MAFKANVVKVCWHVETMEKNGYHKHSYIIMAESEETAKLQVPEREEIISVTKMDGGGDEEA